MDLLVGKRGELLLELSTEAIEEAIRGRLQPAWHPRTHSYTLHRERWKRQRQIWKRSCDNHIRRAEEELAATSNPYAQSAISMKILMLRRERSR